MPVTIVSAALVVGFVFLACLAFVHGSRRERVLRLIAAGSEDRESAAVARQLARLEDPIYGDKLAGRLERALQQARGWRNLPVASRPPPAVRLVAQFGHEIEDILALIESGAGGAQPMALLELMMVGGYSSVLYLGQPDELRSELWRIRYFLAVSGGHLT